MPKNSPLLDQPALDRVRAELARPTDGDVVLAFLDRHGTLALCLPFEENVAHADELWMREVVRQIRAISLPTVVVVLHRSDGRATRADRAVHRELVRRLGGGPVEQVGLAVLGSASAWQAPPRAA